MKKESEQLGDIIHRLRGLQQGLNSFVESLEAKVRADGNALSNEEFQEYCDVVAICLKEAAELVDGAKKMVS